jgi:ATP-dependent DNA helicase RecG
MDQAEFTSIVLELARLPKETEWVEFKLNKEDPDEIGGDLSALSNSASLLGKTRAFIIWGIKDETHEILGTEFKPRHAKIGNEELENWLIRLLSPRIDFRIHEAEIDGNHIVMFEVPAASNHPVRFKDQEYIRIGSYSKKLKDFPEKERSLWCVFQNLLFESGISKEKISADEVLSLIDYPKYFTLMQNPLPENKDSIIQRLESEKIIQPIEGGNFNITNVGAILFARSLSEKQFL